jgi:hypothetical protein
LILHRFAAANGYQSFAVTYRQSLFQLDSRPAPESSPERPMRHTIAALSAPIEMPNPLLPERKIVGFHQDDLGDWVADLECGHSQHVRHNPPWTIRPWVVTEAGRAAHLEKSLPCRECEREV